jgi:hypothetical protein
VAALPSDAHLGRSRQIFGRCLSAWRIVRVFQVLYHRILSNNVQEGLFAIVPVMANRLTVRCRRMSIYATLGHSPLI